MGLREALWALVLLLLVYGGWQFLRALLAARRVRGEKPAPGAQAGRSAPPPGQGGAEEAEDLEDDGDGPDDGFDYAPALRSAPAAAPPPAEEGFHGEVEIRRLRREMATLQHVIERQHDEIEALNAELHRLRAQLDSAAENQASSSPEYAEALFFAAQGLSAEEIAARCGITVAEAELVLSLSDGRGRRP